MEDRLETLPNVSTAWRHLSAVRRAVFGLAVIGSLATSSQAAPLDASELAGIWTATMDTRALLHLCISISHQPDGSDLALLHVPVAEGSEAKQSEGEQPEERTPVWRDGERLRFESARYPIAFNGAPDDEGNIEGFIEYGSFVQHVVLAADGCARHSGAGTRSTSWSALGVRAGRFPIDLYVEQDDSGVAGYLFFRQPTLPACWTYGFGVQEGTVRFREKNLGLVFEGHANEARNRMELTVTALGGSMPIVFTRIDAAPDRQGVPRDPTEAPWTETRPEQLDDGWQTATPSSVGMDPQRLAEMVQAIVSQELTLTHSVLVVRYGRLVFEEYFYGFTRDMPHDTRSASKTFATALVGAAIDRGHLSGVDARVLPLLPRYRDFDNWDARKAQISIEDCLRMASGLDADDSNDTSLAAEWRYQSQTTQPDWLKFALDAPMIAEPGAQPRYGSANPMIVGGVLQAVLSEPLELFAHRVLFAPLGVQDYRLFLDPLQNVYLGGGMHLRPRDLARFGQLQLNGGTWNGKRILDENHVRESMAKRGRLANVRDKNEYGYLWWHREYVAGRRAYASIEARGAGGQYVCILPELDLVAVITSGNYRNGRFRQPEDILERYIVPAVVPMR